MALLSTAGRTARVGQGAGTIGHTATRFLTIGLLGVALLLALVAGVAAGQGGGPVAAVSEAAATGGGQYRLSPPNELDGDGNAITIPATGELAVYRVSAPNERDPEGSFSGGATAGSHPAYRVSPPDERDPAGP